MVDTVQYVTNRVKETTTKTGTGATINLDGAVSGYRKFAVGSGDGARVTYVMEDDAGNWEIGVGAVASGSPDTITRESVIDSSAVGAVDWPAGTKTIFMGKVSSAMDRGQHADYVADSFFFLAVDTSDDTPTVMQQVAETGDTFADDSVASILIHANKDDNSDAKAWELKVLFSGGSPVGSPTPTVIGATAGASAWDITDVAVDGDGLLQITVVGEAATTIFWSAKTTRA